MNELTRRDFLRTSLAVGATLGLPAYSWARVAKANETIRAAVVGFGGRGSAHISGLSKIPGVQVVALCDADKDILAKGVQSFEKRGQKVEGYVDVRKLFDNKDIDVVTTATPNHWHSLFAIWACQAGKDVYVEKPVSHNVWEGRQIVLAAKKYRRIVVAGTQSRSSTGIAEAIQFLRKGRLGKIKWARGLCYKRRASIGKVAGEQPVPPSVDYDLWSGPAPLLPVRRERFHYDWHWLWAYGNGDLGNQGIHQMDIARWALGETALAPRVMSIGGRLGYVDDGETPNTQIIYLEYRKAPLIFEVRGLPKSKDDKAMDSFMGAGVGVIVQCEHGYVTIPNYTGGTVHDNDGKKLQEFKGAEDHFANFIKAVRSRKESDIVGKIQDGHLSSALCHMGNISHVLGRTAPPGEIREQIKGNKEASASFERFQEHLAANGVDLAKTPATIGPWLKMNPSTERFTGNDKANALLTRDYRAPFVVPKKV